MTDDLRVNAVNGVPERGDGDFVLYWQIAARRTHWSFALDRAVERAVELGKPLVVLEALRSGYRWASDRLHRFVLEGMRDNDAALDGVPALYHPYLEREEDAGKGLLEALGRRAALVVTDEQPGFFLPRMVARAGELLDVRLEAVDSNGLLPLRAAPREFPTAHAFRRFLQRELPAHLDRMPSIDPFDGVDLPVLSELPDGIAERWPRVGAEELDDGVDLSELPIDHDVPPAGCEGGEGAAGRALARFLDERLARYDDDRNQPEKEVTSGLSPYLHFGHLSVHEVLATLAEREGWSPDDLGDDASGRRSGWWGMSEPAESFLDELVTWREVGYQTAFRRDDHDRYESLPDWARETLEEHEGDPREHVYSLREFEEARTHDALWNAAQRQLVREGRIHNYLRMLWGKKILEWTASPRDALEVMIELNNRYGVDGRDPNSYSGILWCLGRYDRPWGPERRVFGKVRYMTSRNTARKVRVQGYVERYAEGGLFT